MAFNYDESRALVINEQLDTYGYTFCQHCQKSKQVFKFEVHHIIFRSEAPEHEHLHNPLNLIILCTECHQGKEGFHAIKEKRDYLIKERKLFNLFSWI